MLCFCILIVTSSNGMYAITRRKSSFRKIYEIYFSKASSISSKLLVLPSQLDLNLSDCYTLVCCNSISVKRFSKVTANDELTSKKNCQSKQSRFMSSATATLFTNAYFINGVWKNAKSTFPVYNPYTGNVIGEAANCTKHDAEDAVNHAFAAFKKWKTTTGKV